LSNVVERDANHQILSTLLHLPDGFGNRSPSSYGLRWNLGQRTIAWVVKRDGAHLARMHDDNAIFFDKLEDAKTIALLHAGDRTVEPNVELLFRQQYRTNRPDT
jgi:hypothetical protein